jgi:hypothetical protein
LSSNIWPVSLGVCTLALFSAFGVHTLFESPTLSTSHLMPDAPGLPPCEVAPPSPVTDPQALAFEEGASAVDTDGLTKATARALTKFQRVVSSVGGSVELKSAYRPPAYQAHLQAVWDKWVLALRDNHQPQCEGVRAEVRSEFLRHRLLETQRPVSISDHSLGIGFDAQVSVPQGARLRRRRATLDLLAKLSGFLRPDVFRDPVHFRLIGGRTITARRALRSGLKAAGNSLRS